MFLAPNVSRTTLLRRLVGADELAWGEDNHTCGFRVVGHRVETCILGGDVNPYLAFAALIAAGLDGVERKLEPPEKLEGERMFRRG